MAPGISVEPKETDIVRRVDIDEQASEISCNQRKKCNEISTLCRNLLRHLRLHFSRHTHEVLNHQIALLLTGVPDSLELLLSIFVRLFFGGCVTLRMLYQKAISTIARFVTADLELCLTSATNPWYSSSFCFL